MSAYQGAPGGPRDPATASGYCLAICWAGCCPQAPAQAAHTAQLREQEHALRDRREGERAARPTRPPRRQVAV